MSDVQFSFSVPSDHPSLAGHFPGRPVVPGVLLLDHVLAALENQAGWSVSCLKQAKFISALFPGELARGEWNLTPPLATFRVCVRRGDIEVQVAQGSGTLSPEVAP
jgi:3-hydroxymyristoyl/3-hydroxydecanoyl-(acyl carrier protein) dehydratase